MPSTGFHVFCESKMHIIEADCELTYSVDPQAAHKSDRFYPTVYSWSDVTVTNKRTGESEFWGEEMPNDLTSFARDAADTEFYEQI